MVAEWTFSPYNLDRWNESKERVLFVGSEPNGENPDGGSFAVRDMGNWFKTARRDEERCGNKHFYTRCEIILAGLGVEWGSFRFMDLKSEWLP